MAPSKRQSKRQEVGTSYVVRADFRVDPRAPLDSEDPYTFVIGDDAEVVGISQTVRRYRDIDEGRKCIIIKKSSSSAAPVEPQPSTVVEDSGVEPQPSTVVEDSGVEPLIVGEHLNKFVERVTVEMRQQDPFMRYSTAAIRTNIFAESLKCLEVKFQSHLESNGGLKENWELLEDMGPVMVVAARKEEGGVGWHMQDSIGVLAEGICLLRTVRDECSGNKDVNEHVTTLVEDAEEFFWEVLKMGIADLDEVSDMSHMELDPNVLEYFKDKKNLSDIVGEWALMSAKRKERNEFSHPFGDHFNKEVRVTALDILKTMIEDPFCGAFKHVASLSRYSLLLDHSKDKHPSGRGSLVSKLLTKMEKLVASKMEKLNVSDEDFGFH